MRAPAALVMWRYRLLLLMEQRCSPRSRRRKEGGGGCGGYRHRLPLHSGRRIRECLYGGKGFDIVYDTVGGATLDASFASVKRYTGHVVSSLGWGSHSLAALSFRGATYSGVFTLLPLITGADRAHHGRILAHAASIADSGEADAFLSEERFTVASWTLLLLAWLLVHLERWLWRSAAANCELVDSGASNARCASQCPAGVDMVVDAARKSAFATAAVASVKHDRVEKPA